MVNISRCGGYEPWYVNQIERPLTDHLIGDVDIAAARILRLRPHALPLPAKPMARSEWLPESLAERHDAHQSPGQGHRGAGCYSITSSARSSSDCGIVSPSALAVLRLMTSS